MGAHTACAGVPGCKLRHAQHRRPATRRQQFTKLRCQHTGQWQQRAWHAQRAWTRAQASVMKPSWRGVARKERPTYCRRADGGGWVFAGAANDLVAYHWFLKAWPKQQGHCACREAHCTSAQGALVPGRLPRSHVHQQRTLYSAGSVCSLQRSSMPATLTSTVVRARWSYSVRYLPAGGRGQF